MDCKEAADEVDKTVAAMEKRKPNQSQGVCRDLYKDGGAAFEMRTKFQLSRYFFALRHKHFVVFTSFKNHNKKLCCTVAQLVSLLPCSKKVLDLNPSLGSFCMEFSCSPRACVGSHRVPRLPPTVQRHAC
ncbi:hypothetical protein ILYODFUR_029877 [Ilyodon furcidens]|uniref:Uncharacterized protein n=1 Tax=Ilyodon furcidens TaxID=33524 RepID=A0ABV0TZX4_9TELE